MYCKSRPSNSSSWLDVSVASQRSIVPVTRTASSSWKRSTGARIPASIMRSRPAAGAEARPAAGQQVGQPPAQLGLRVGGLGAQCVLDLLPQLGGPVAQQRAAQDVVLEALPALAQLRIGLQAVREPGEPRVELTAGFVIGVGGHGDQALAQPGVQPV